MNPYVFVLQRNRTWLTVKTVCTQDNPAKLFLLHHHIIKWIYVKILTVSKRSQNHL